MSAEILRELALPGEFSTHCVAISRASRPQALLTVAPRLTRSLGDSPPTGEVGGDTTLSMDRGTRWRCLLSDRTLDAPHGVLALCDVLAVLPVAVLEMVR